MSNGKKEYNFKVGDETTTNGGDPVRIICNDLLGAGEIVLIGLVNNDSLGKERIGQYTITGRSTDISEGERPYDLMPLS